MKALASKFGLYLITGGVAALVDISGLMFLVGAGMPLAWATCLSFLTASVVNYVFSARVVFRQSPTLVQYFRFLLGAFFGGAVNVTITLLGVHYFSLAPAPAKIAGVAIAFLANFTVNVSIVFRRRKNDVADARQASSGP